MHDNHTIFDSFYEQCERTPDKIIYTFVNQKGQDQEHLTYHPYVARKCIQKS